MKKIINILTIFKVPFLVALSIAAYLILYYQLHLVFLARTLILIAIFVGSLDLVKDTLSSLLKKQFALDYIALLAITVALLTQQYLVAAVIVLMLSGGNTLEDYGMMMAKKSLTALTDRIPSEVVLYENGKPGEKMKIENVQVGQEIVVRKGEVIPLDGLLQSEAAYVDESSLTGEPYMMDRSKGDKIRSGTINAGNPIVIKVTNADKDSTYRKIVEMVKQAQDEKAPLIRLADRYSAIFTIITFTISAVAYLISHDFTRVLAVLVIATPCPLILATPIALMGGMNSSAKKRIIVKRLSSLEVLARVKTMIFDKTGTLTLGRPTVSDLRISDTSYTVDQIYAIAEAIERHSLHPLAKAIVAKAKQEKITPVSASDIEEKMGVGISGKVNNHTFTLSKVPGQGMAIQLLEGKKHIATFHFQDEIKKGSQKILDELKKIGLDILIFTGDKKEAAEQVVQKLGLHVTVKAECTPEDKKNGIADLKKEGRVTGMVGDGINDAPALAAADVGMVFSNEEQTAASEAADIVFLGGDFSLVLDAIYISRRTIFIALQSILAGIGVSVIGMLFAATGHIPPIVGAFIQEAIDVMVILNALRASR
jgi:heavy metal translocating P-type ATPase